MASIEKTQSLRASITRAEFSKKLLAPPTAYDLAPRYILDSYRGTSTALTKALAPTISNPSYDRIAHRDVAKDVRVALELAAPIALGGVRVVLIGASLIAYASNPVTLILGGPALLLTGKKVLDDLRRAFVVDPAVRRHVQLAHEAAVQGDLPTADQHFKDALAVDVNPSNPRNADIHLQQGLLYIQHRRPRQALIALTKASVLISEHEAITQKSAGGVSLKLSKRGVAEMLALACLDSFAKDDAGIEEWNEIAKDFAGSALLRFERFADAKDAGHLFGLFGIDTTSADANRALVAKVRFLQAKLESRKNLSLATSKQRLLLAVNEGRQLLLDDPSLTQEERATALMEQAQFYFSATTREQRVQLDMLKVALSLVEEASTLYSSFDLSRSILARAEAISFALAAIPRAVEQGSTTAGETTKAVASCLERLVADVEDSGLDGSNEYLLWAHETLYRLHGDAPDKQRALETARAVATRTKDHVAHFHCALRMTFLQRDGGSRDDVLSATTAMSEYPDPVVAAFGFKYLAEMTEGERAVVLFRNAADKFEVAAAHTQSNKQYQPFYLQGHAVVHDWQASTVVLNTIGAYCFLRAGCSKEALRSIEAADVAALQAGGADLQGVLDVLRAVANAVGGDVDARAELDRALSALPDGSRETFGRWIAKLMERVDRASVGTPVAADGSRTAEARHESAGGDRDTALQGFQRDRDALDATVRSAVSLAREAGAQELASLLSGHHDRLSEGRFNLAIVGEFSTGKSTFINAILGTRLLPSSARPTTAAVNRIVWAAEAGATIHLADGTARVISTAELAEYITERRNPGNRKSVAGVEIRHPLPLLSHGITLLDTPGIASLIQAHTDLTYQTIPNCDAVLLITSATMPFSATEREFLVALREQLAGKVFLVINKVDQLSHAESARVIEFVRENAQKVLPGIRVFPVSSYWALASRLVSSGEADRSVYVDDPMTGGVFDPGPLMEGSRFAPFEEDLFKFLVENKGRLLMEGVARSATQTLNDVRRNTDAELRAQSLSVAEVREKARALLHQAQGSRDQLDAVLKECEEAFDATQATFSERLRSERAGLSRAVERSVQAVPAEQLADLNLGAVITEEFQRWSAHTTADLARQTRLAIEQAVAAFNTISQELTASYDRSFELDFSGTLPVVSMEDVQIEESTAGSFGRSFLHGGIIGLTTALLGPVGILAAIFGSAYVDSKIAELKAKKLRERYLEESQRAVDEAVQQLQALASARFKRVKETTLRSLRDQAEGVLRRFENNAKSLVEQREQTEQQAAERGAVLRSRASAIARLLRALDAFGGRGNEA